MIALLQRKPYISFSALLLLNLLLLSVQVRNEEGRLLLRSWGLMVFTPIASGVHFLADGVVDAVHKYALLLRVQEENDRLDAENARLRVELSQLQGIKSTLAHRRDDQLLQDQFFFDTFLAPVIWRSAPFYAHRVVINGGSREGINKDDAAIIPEGVVGRVWAITPFTSEIELITNAGAAAGAMLAESRLQGVVQGDGSRFLRWDFIPNYETVKVGDVVYTSGADRIYPKGLPIGSVVESTKSSAVYRNIKVQPFVDYLRLEEILVVTSE